MRFLLPSKLKREWKKLFLGEEKLSRQTLNQLSTNFVLLLLQTD